MDTLYLARHGETVYNTEDRMGGDSSLTEKGLKQAEKIGGFLKNVELDIILCSGLIRSVDTANIIASCQGDVHIKSNKNLNELLTGELDGITYTEFRRKYESLYNQRRNDKFDFSFPGGESYSDLTIRTSQVVEDLLNNEIKECGLIVGHQAVNRTVLGYLMGLSNHEIPYLIIPQDGIFEINLKGPERTSRLIKFPARVSFEDES